MTNKHKEVLNDLSSAELIGEVKRRISPEEVKKYLQERKDLEKAIEQVCTSIITAKVDEPEFFYKYPATREEFDYYQLYKWADMMNFYQHMAEQ